MRKIAILLALVAMCAALTSCGIMIDMLDSMLEHEHGYTYTLEPGEEEGTFDLVGRCPYEYCENPISYAAENVEVTYTVLEGNCTDGSKVVYSYTFEGETYSYTMEKVGVGHKLCGLPIDRFYINGSMIDSSVPGVTIINEASAKCGGTAEAFYTCDVCAKSQIVLAYVSHKGNWTLDTAPSCTVDGKEHINCERCQMLVERSVAAYGHNHEVTIQQNLDGTSNIIYSCTVSGCSNRNLRINSAEGVVEISRKEPSCTESGSIVYNYTKNGTAGTITMTKRPLEHTLGGTAVSSILNSDGTIDYGIVGVTVVNQSQLSCGKVASGHYCCDNCATLVPTTVYVRPHHIEPEKDWETIAPTCQRQGTITKSCKYCDYEITEYTKEPSLDKYHVMRWDFSNFNSTNIAATLTSGECLICGFDIINAPMDAGSYNCTNVKATCTKAGEITHNWTVNGIAVQYITTNITTDHMITDNNGKNVPAWSIADENGYFDYALDSVHLFAGGSISCGETADGNYRCAVCKEVVVITVTKNHTMKEQSSIAATCTSNGYTIFKCTSCGVQDSTVILASHNIEYVHNLDNNTLTQRCTNKTGDCNYSETVINLSTGNLAIRRVIKTSTCCEYGSAEYTFISNDGRMINFVGKLDFSSHTIKDNSGKVVSADTLCDENGHYDSSLNAIRYFAGTSAPVLGQTASGYFICESCGEPVMVIVKNNGNN